MLFPWGMTIIGCTRLVLVKPIWVGGSARARKVEGLRASEAAALNAEHWNGKRLKVHHYFETLPKMMIELFFVVRRQTVPGMSIGLCQG